MASYTTWKSALLASLTAVAGMFDAMASAFSTEVDKKADTAVILTGRTWTGAVNLGADASKEGIIHATLTGNATVTLPTPSSTTPGYTVTLRLKQDSTGGRSVIFKQAFAPWATVITLTPTANAIDLIHLMWSGTEWWVLPSGQAGGIPTGWAI